MLKKLQFKDVDSTLAQQLLLLDTNIFIEGMILLEDVRIKREEIERAKMSAQIIRKIYGGSFKLGAITDYVLREIEEVVRRKGGRLGRKILDKWYQNVKQDENTCVHIFYIKSLSYYRDRYSFLKDPIFSSANGYSGLGPGEASLLTVAFETGISNIVSDDLGFLKFGREYILKKEFKDKYNRELYFHRLEYLCKKISIRV